MILRLASCLAYAQDGQPAHGCQARGDHQAGGGEADCRQPIQLLLGLGRCCPAAASSVEGMEQAPSICAVVKACSASCSMYSAKAAARELP